MPLLPPHFNSRHAGLVGPPRKVTWQLDESTLKNPKALLRIRHKASHYYGVCVITSENESSARLSRDVRLANHWGPGFE